MLCNLLTIFCDVRRKGFLELLELAVEGLDEHGNRDHGLGSEVIDWDFALNTLNDALEAHQIDEEPIRR